MPVNVEQPPISGTPFINPSPDPRATGSVRPPGQDQEGSALKKQKGVGKSKHKKSSKPAAAAGSASQVAVDAVPAPKTVVPGPGLQVLDKPDTLTFSSITSAASTVSTSVPDPLDSFVQPVATSVPDPPDSFVQPEPALSDVDIDPLPDWSDRDSGEEGELSDTEVTEKKTRK